MNEFGTLAGYKTNTQKSAFLNTNDERSEREIKETIAFTIISKIILGWPESSVRCYGKTQTNFLANLIKYLGINLPREGKNLYSEN